MPGLDLMQVYQSFRQGQESARENRLRDISEQAKAAQGAALQGNEQAMNDLAGLDPQAYVGTKSYLRDQQKADTAEFLSAAYAAKTPEAWKSVVDSFRAKGHKFDPGEDDFANRDNLLRQGMSVADQMGIDLKSQEFAAETARWERNFAATQDYRDRSLAIQQQAVDARSGVTPSGYRRSVNGDLEAIPGGPADPKVKNPPKPMNASMLKLKRETENNLIDIGNTRDNLKAALALVGTETKPGDVMSGFAPETRAFIGNTLPDVMVPDAIASPKGAEATKNYSNIMNLESIQRMASTLKGATTDFELNEFVKILSDPSAPNSVKRQTINRMLKLADQQEALEQQRLDEFGGNMPGDGEAEAGSERSPVGEWTPDQRDLINQAEEAINAGADPQAVIDRLRTDHGIDVELGGK